MVKANQVRLSVGSEWQRQHYKRLWLSHKLASTAPEFRFIEEIIKKRMRTHKRNLFTFLLSIWWMQRTCEKSVMK